MRWCCCQKQHASFAWKWVNDIFFRLMMWVKVGSNTIRRVRVVVTPGLIKVFPHFFRPSSANFCPNRFESLVFWRVRKCSKFSFCRWIYCFGLSSKFVFDPTLMWVLWPSWHYFLFIFTFFLVLMIFKKNSKYISILIFFSRKLCAHWCAVFLNNM